MTALPERTARFEAFVAPAAARPQLWRLLLGSGLAVATWLITVALVLAVVTQIRAEAPERFILVGYLAAFAGLLLGLALAARLQGRGLGSLIGPGGFQPRRFLQGVLVVVVVGAIGFVPMALIDPPTRQLGLGTWAAWLPLALPALLLQTTAEELAFRGWLMQGLGARFRDRFAWWVLPALLFGLMHWNPAELGQNAWLVVVSTALVGLILGDVTARLGNASLAMGLHFANNAVALLIVALPSPLAALSLYLSDVDVSDAGAMRTLFLLDLGTTLGAYALWVAIFARRLGAAPGSEA